DLDRASGGGGIVEVQATPSAAQRVGGELATGGAGMHGGETLPAHGQPSDAVVGMAVVLADVERPLAIAGVDDAVGGHVVAVGPVERIRPGAHPGFEEGAIPVNAVAARHED